MIINEIAEEVFPRAVSMLDSLRHNQGPLADTTVSFTEPDREKALVLAQALYVSCMEDKKVKAMTATRQKLPFAYDPDTQQYKITLPIRKMGANSWQEIGEMIDARQEELRLHIETSRLPKKKSKQFGIDPEEEKLISAQIEARQEQTTAEEELAKVNKARQLKPFDTADIIGTLKYFQNNSPLEHRENAIILADTIMDFAAALDVRDEKTLALAGATESEKNHVAMQRELAKRLLSKATLQRAADAIQVPDMFGEKRKYDESKYIAAIPDTIDYLKSHPDAQVLLRAQSTNNPGLLLLLQASILPELIPAKEGEPLPTACETYLSALKNEDPDMEVHKGELSEAFVKPQLKEFLDEHCPLEKAAQFKRSEGQTLAEAMKPRTLGERVR